jgi:hypothetical protein
MISMRDCVSLEMEVGLRNVEPDMMEGRLNIYIIICINICINITWEVSMTK